jgi:acetoin utilization deacetylase AcuC-like enzyme
VLLLTDPRFLDHDTGGRHPEAPARLDAVLAGIARSGAEEALVPVEPRPATAAELERVHLPQYLAGLERFCAAGGGRLDMDTVMGAESFHAAVLAAGAGLVAVERLDAGEGDAAFLAVRPPGHHARPAGQGPTRQRGDTLGFCLINNVAVAAAALADRGERVLIVDWDAHHGNGTQAAFWDDDRVLFVSMHEWGPDAYPWTGGLSENRPTTINLPFPAGTTAHAYRAAIDEVVVPAAEQFGTTWVIVSAGFDAHRADPMTDLGLSAGDYVDLTADVVGLAPPGRRLVFLEGGYDLDALAASAAACVSTLAGSPVVPEPRTGAGPGRDVVESVRRLRLEQQAADN